MARPDTLKLIERKAILEALIGKRGGGDSLQYRHDVIDSGHAVLDVMCAAGHEGIIAKAADARYVGDRTKTWLKIKCTSGGTAAVPVTWHELSTIDRANSFDIFAAAERAQGPDAWEGYFETEQVLTQPVQEVVQG